MNDPAPRNSRFVTILFLTVFLLVTLLLLRLLAAYLAALVLALVLVSLFHPVFTRICARLGGRRRVAAGLTSALVVLLVLIPSLLAVSALSAEALAVYQRATAADAPLIDRLMSWLYDGGLAPRLMALGEQAGLDLTPEAVRKAALGGGAAMARSLYAELGGLASNVARIVMNFALMVVVIFALLTDGPRLKAYVLDLSPLPDDQEMMLVSRFAGISRAVFLGNGVASLLQGICGGLGFLFFGIGSGVLWGTAIAFFAFLPIVGASIIFVPAALYLVLKGEPGMAVGFLAYNAAYVAVLEYGLKPKLIGDQSRMHGVLVFMGIIAGLSVFGILGLFYGPLILTMFLTLAEIYRSSYRAELMSVQSPWVRAETGEEGEDASLAVAVAPAQLPDPALAAAAAARRQGNVESRQAGEGSDESSRPSLVSEPVEE